ncbi:MAG: hypothetical protein IT530_10995 [Burkholderiales bacterium]|nr:hypothetical protein [Burkholderiales bacterium]
MLARHTVWRHALLAAAMVAVFAQAALAQIYAQYLKREIEKYGKFIKDTGIVMN